MDDYMHKVNVSERVSELNEIYTIFQYSKKLRFV